MLDEFCESLSRRLTRSSLRALLDRRRRSTPEHPVCIAERLTLHPVPQRIGFGPYSFQLPFVEPDRISAPTRSFTPHGSS